MGSLEWGNRLVSEDAKKEPHLLKIKFGNAFLGYCRSNTGFLSQGLWACCESTNCILPTMSFRYWTVGYSVLITCAETSKYQWFLWKFWVSVEKCPYQITNCKLHISNECSKVVVLYFSLANFKIYNYVTEKIQNELFLFLYFILFLEREDHETAGVCQTGEL